MKALNSSVKFGNRGRALGAGCIVRGGALRMVPLILLLVFAHTGRRQQLFYDGFQYYLFCHVTTDAQYVRFLAALAFECFAASVVCGAVYHESRAAFALQDT